jgi:hypothetical protein
LYTQFNLKSYFFSRFENEKKKKQTYTSKTEKQKIKLKLEQKYLQLMRLKKGRNPGFGNYIINVSAKKFLSINIRWFLVYQKLTIKIKNKIKITIKEETKCKLRR